MKIVQFLMMNISVNKGNYLIMNNLMKMLFKLRLETIHMADIEQLIKICII